MEEALPYSNHCSSYFITHKPQADYSTFFLLCGVVLLFFIYQFHYCDTAKKETKKRLKIGRKKCVEKECNNSGDSARVTHGHKLMQDPLGFLSDCDDPWVSLPIGNGTRKVHVLLDPNSVEKMYDNPALSGTEVDVYLKQIIRGAGKDSGITKITKDMENYHVFLTESYQHLKTDESREEKLEVFINKTQFRAIFNTIFGRSEEESFNHLSVTDRMPSCQSFFTFSWVKELAEKSEFIETTKKNHPTKEQLLDKPDLSNYMRCALNYMDSSPVGDTCVDVFGHSMLYLESQYVACKMAFWILVFLMEDLLAFKCLEREIQERIDEKVKEDGEVVFTVREIEKEMPILNSIVMETYRLVSSTVIVRKVMENATFETDGAVQHAIQRGDRLVMYTTVMHRDAGVYNNAQKFQFDRFVDSHFRKRGRPLKRPLVACGSESVGNRLAMAQVNWFIITMLHKFRLQLVTKATEIQIDLGGDAIYKNDILPPKCDVIFRYEARTVSEKLVLGLPKTSKKPSVEKIGTD